MPGRPFVRSDAVLSVLHTPPREFVPTNAGLATMRSRSDLSTSAIDAAPGPSLEDRVSDALAAVDAAQDRSGNGWTPELADALCEIETVWAEVELAELPPEWADIRSQLGGLVMSMHRARERHWMNEQAEPILAALESDGYRITPEVELAVEATVKRLRSDELNRQVEAEAGENPDSLFVRLASPFPDPPRSRERQGTILTRRSTPHQGRSRAAKSPPTRTRGSRRGSGSRAAPSDDPGESEPPARRRRAELRQRRRRRP